jgi:hypothetical protein
MGIGGGGGRRGGGGDRGSQGCSSGSRLAGGHGQGGSRGHNRQTARRSLSRTPRLPAIAANQCGQTGPQCNRPMCLSKTLSKEMPRGKAVVSAARGTSWYSRCDNQSECLIKTKDARDGTTTTKRTQCRTVRSTTLTHGSRASTTRAHQQGSMATSSCILSHTRRDAHQEPAHPHPPAL